MKNLLYIIVATLSLGLHAQAVIADNMTPDPVDPAAVLEVQSNSRGMIVPRLTDDAMTTLSTTAAEGLIIFNTDDKCYYGFQQNDWFNLDGNCLPAPPEDPVDVFEEGSFAFTGFESENSGWSTNNAADKISLVTFGTITAGNVFYMTDSGWKADGTFRDSEGLLKWTVTNDIPARTEIVFQSPQEDQNQFEWTVSTGTVEAAPGSSAEGIAFNQAGDNLIVFTATDDTAPYTNIDKFITALKLETNWDADATTSTTSAIPTGLVDGDTAVAILATSNNMKIDCQFITPGMTQEQIRAVANDYTKWISITTSSESLPTNCSY